MAKDTSLTVSLFGRDVSFGKTLNGAGKHAKTTEQQFRSLARGATVAFGAITAAATMSVKAAMEDQAAAVQLGQTLKNTMGATKAQTAAVEKYISTLSIASAKSDEELRPAYDRLIRSTGSYTKTQNLMNVAIDLAYSKNISVADAAKALAKANEGNITALKRMGVKLPEITKGMSKQAAAAKVLAAVQKQYAGATASASETSAFKMKQFEVGMQELKETIGYELLPMFNKFIKRLPEMLDFLTRNKEAIKKVAAVVLVLSGTIMSINGALKVFHALQSVTKFAALIARWTGFSTVVTTEATAMAGAGTAVNIAWAPFLLTVAAIAAAFVGINLVLNKIKKNREALLNDPKKIPSWSTESKRLDFLGNRPTSMSAVPKHAKGGIVTRPHLGIVGEAGPEAIIPLNKANGLGGITIINNIRGHIMTEKELALVIRNDIAQLMRRKGLNPSILGV